MAVFPLMVPDGRIYGRRDRPCYRDTRTHLKRTRREEEQKEQKVEEEEGEEEEEDKEVEEEEK